MISLEVAKQLKEAGLAWTPAIHDFFSVPFPDLDNRVFVLSDMTINQEVLHGWPALTFSGAMEWAMDYILTMDVVWMPSEGQLRELIVSQKGVEQVQLNFVAGTYQILVRANGHEQLFTDDCAEDAYGKALLHLLL